MYRIILACYTKEQTREKLLCKEFEKAEEAAAFVRSLKAIMKANHYAMDFLTIAGLPTILCHRRIHTDKAFAIVRL